MSALNLKQLIGPYGKILKISGLMTKSLEAFESKTSQLKTPAHFFWRWYNYIVSIYLLVLTFRVVPSLPFFRKYVASHFKQQPDDEIAVWGNNEVFFASIQIGFGLAGFFVMRHFIVSEDRIVWLCRFAKLWLETSYRVGQDNSEVDYFDSYKARTSTASIAAAILSAIVFDLNHIITVYSNPQANLSLFNFIWFLPVLLWNIILVMVISVSVAYFCLICFLIRRKYQEVNEDLDLLSIEEDEHVLMHALKNLQVKYYKVCEMTSVANTFWKEYIFYMYAIFIPIFCEVFHEVLFGVGFNKVQMASLIWFSINILAVLFLLSYSASDIVTQAYRPQDKINLLSISDLPAEGLLAVNSFANRVDEQHIGISFLDIFIIKRTKIIAVLTLTFSYFSILMNMVSETHFRIKCDLPKERLDVSEVFRDVFRRRNVSRAVD